MPALRKPHRIAVLVPQLAIEGGDAAYAAEAGLLVWMTCIEHLRRHPGLAVYDAESTPLFPRDGHFAPQHALVGATPVDGFFASTRRDELIWLELGLPKGVVKLHALPRAGERKTFEGMGRMLGDQLDHAFNSWLSGRGLAASTRKLAPLAGEDVIATVRVIGSGLVEHARKWTA
ncbi:MAG: hypothetical protein H0V17_01865, partial [Deltaproteobacteria bacterium]|nr:hypothetical protein [Deltaproteobacteria bacterium]